MQKNGRALKAHKLTFLFRIDELNLSFLDLITMFLVEIIFGLDQTLLYRLSVPDQGISGSQNTMEFGQLVPLFLLALPCLALFELYSGKSTGASKTSCFGRAANCTERHKLSGSAPADTPVTVNNGDPNEQTPADAVLAIGGSHNVPRPNNIVSEAVPEDSGLEKLSQLLGANPRTPGLKTFSLEEVSPEIKLIGGSDRIDTGFALREYNNYQSRRSGKNENTALQTSSSHDAAETIASIGNESINPASNAHDVSPISSETPAKEGGYRTSFGKILAFLLVSRVVGQVLIVLCINGHLGYAGYYIAIGLMVLYLVVGLFDVIRKSRMRMEWDLILL